MTHPLGKWAVIDIETSGADPSYDSVIDLGFLQFEGTKLVRQYSSLVQYQEKLSQFIQKLTGITDNMLVEAPGWQVVKTELLDLYGHHLIAHNSDFERSFLQSSFDQIDDGNPRESYQDSILFLALLCPDFSSLKLEQFICDWKLRPGELHRGLADSVDLLKVMLIALKRCRRDREYFLVLDQLFKQYQLTDYWFYSFFKLTDQELEEIAEQIDFDLNQALEALHHTEEQTLSDKGLDFNLEFSGKNIEQILRSEEKIRQVLPNYRYRSPQKDLALKVGQSFKNSVHALVQAPTGTGKTLGYLLPAALFCLQEEKKVLVATGTKTLQHQAMHKDVPQLRSLLGLGEDFKIVHLIGSNNHLCQLLFRQEVEEDLLFANKGFDEKLVELYFALAFYYNSRHGYAEQITREQIPHVLRMKLKNFSTREREIAVDFRSCSGFRCPYRDECSYMCGLAQAKEASLIIGNHALMFAWPSSLPRPEYIVVDEAHKLEGETTSAYSLEVTQESITSFIKNLQHLNGLGSLFYLLGLEGSDSTAIINRIKSEAESAQQMLNDHMIPLPELFEQYFKKMPRYTDQFWNELPMIVKETNKDALSASIYNHIESIKNIVANFSSQLIPYRGMWDIKNLKDEKQVTALTRYETFLGQLDDLELGLNTLWEAKEEYSYSLKFHENFGLSLLAAPINVGQVLHQNLLNACASVVFTSATLGNAQGDCGIKGIEWATGHIYLPPEKRFKGGFYLPAVYDYANKARVFVCDDTLPFYQSSFVEMTLAPIAKLIRQLEGRSLLLFSARARFEAAREILLAEFEGEIPLFIQGMGNNVVEEFKKSGSGILLGMESFGEGIDVPGDALQFIFIDKIPDLRMDLVIQKRRDFFERTLGNEFTDYYLATRTRMLQQKLGRLLRTENDFGGVIVVDSRIKKWKGGTLDKFEKLMSPYQVNRATLQEACQGILSFLGKGEEKLDG